MKKNEKGRNEKSRSDKRKSRYWKIAWNFFVLKLHGEVLVDGVLPELEEMTRYEDELLSVCPKIKEMDAGFLQSIVSRILEGIRKGEFENEPCGLPYLIKGGRITKGIKRSTKTNDEIYLTDQ